MIDDTTLGYKIAAFIFTVLGTIFTVLTFFGLSEWVIVALMFMASNTLLWGMIFVVQCKKTL